MPPQSNDAVFGILSSTTSPGSHHSQRDHGWRKRNEKMLERDIKREEGERQKEKERGTETRHNGYSPDKTLMAISALGSSPGPST